MSMESIRSRLALALLLGGVAGMAHASCGQAFCVVNTNWAMQGVPSEPGSSRLDLRYEAINQNRLWRGTRGVSAADDDSDALEKRTNNRNLIATYDYTASNAWGFSFVVPVQQRLHEHVADPAGDATYEKWNFTRLGDVKALANYSVTNDDDPLNRYGVQFGVKLPTGSHTVSNGDSRRAERALQPGSGSTDLIVGGYYTHRGLTPGAAWFGQVSYQQAALTQDAFRPGSQTAVTLGYNQPVTGDLSATLQINALRKDHDRGANAEPALSGGKYAFVSPGLSYAAAKTVQLYGYVQLPVYRNVNGIQLVASRAFVGGMSFQF